MRELFEMDVRIPLVRKFIFYIKVCYLTLGSPDKKQKYTTQALLQHTRKHLLR